MLTRLRQALAGLLDKPIGVGEALIRLPNGHEYLRIDRDSAPVAPGASTKNTYDGDQSRIQRREAAMTLVDDDTFGFLLIILKPRRIPANLIGQVPREWRPYIGAILGRVLAEYARERPRSSSRAAR